MGIKEKNFRSLSFDLMNVSSGSLRYVEICSSKSSQPYEHLGATKMIRGRNTGKRSAAEEWELTTQNWAKTSPGVEEPGR